MTTKFVGKISLNGSTVLMPKNTELPEKKQWFKYAVWEFNGKVYRPLTALAEQNLNEVILTLQGLGKTKAVKEAKRKPSSLRYAILTTGVEDFSFV